MRKGEPRLSVELSVNYHASTRPLLNPASMGQWLQCMKLANRGRLHEWQIAADGSRWQSGKVVGLWQVVADYGSWHDRQLAGCSRLHEWQIAADGSRWQDRNVAGLWQVVADYGSWHDR
eukprot:255675-Pelagomonas_calceolata.AAC.4